MYFDSSFYKEEIRSDFLVTEERKKIWAVELELLEKFDEVCRKHHLTYYAAYGTLLGAARHQGFIPWDDDIDLVMFRDDYMKLINIGPSEFTEPHFFQNIYTDRMIRSYSKLRDSRTTAIEHPDMDDYNQGIFIDIFPLDDVPHGDENTTILQIQMEMWQTIIHPREVLHSIEENKEFILPKDVLFNLMRMDVHRRMQEFETFSFSHFGQSEYVNFLLDEFFPSSYRSIKREWNKDIIYLPFEHMEIPVPACYEQVLTSQYGDWHQFVRGGSAHENIILDPDVPYTTYINLYKQQKV